MNMKSSLLVIIAMASAIFLPVLFMQGMFMDGLIYSIVSRNMLHAQNMFHCYVSDTYLNPFFEQPPLSMILQSQLLRITNDVFFADRLFGYLAFMITLLSLFRIAKLFSNSITNAYLPLFFLMMIPVVDWSYKNGMLENWMCAFTTLSSYFLLSNMVSDKPRKMFVLYASIFIVSAFLTKGFTGLFPLAIPFIYHLVFNKKWKSAILDSLKLILVTGVILMLTFMLLPELKKYFVAYLNKQVLSSLEGNRELDGHFFILKRVPQELIPLFIITILVFAIAHYKYKLEMKEVKHKKYVMFFLLITLSGSLPVMVSPKQSGYYVLCSYPFFALFFSALLNDRIQLLRAMFLTESRQEKLKIVSAIVIAVSIILSIVNYGSYYRDKEKIQLVEDVSTHLKGEKKILIDWNLQTDYSLKCYFYRRDFISVYTPNFTWVKAHYHLSTEMLADKKLVKKYVVDHRDLFLYQN